MDNLSHIKISGFKSIKELDLEIKHINVLIGANGSGKTNFISVFKFLDVIYQKKLQTYITQNGGADRFLHFGSKKTDKIVIDLKLRLNSYLINLIKDKDSNALFIEYDEGNFEGDIYPLPYRKITGNAPESNIADDEEGIVSYLRHYLRQCKLYHFHDTSDSAKFKSHQDIHSNDFLWSDAGNLAPFLLRLKNNYSQDYQNIINVVQTVAPFFHDFSFKKNGEGVLLRWQHKNDLQDAGFSANNLSDGTARFICMATLFLQPEKLRPKTIVLDEPEIGLHPTAITVLSEIIKSTAQNGSQVIVSTQSVTLANCFEPDDFIVVEQEAGVSKFKRFSEEEKQELKRWLEEYQMGDAWEEGLLGGLPKW